MENTDVLIIGAGPTGLTLACELARRGVQIKVVEKSKEAFHGSRGKGVQPRTIEIFDDLGVAGKLLAAGTQYPKMSAHISFLRLKWYMVKPGKVTANVPYPSTWLVPQWRTEEVLRSRLAEFGQAVAYGCEAVSIEQNSESVSVQVRQDGSDRTIRARYVVGADGGRSFVRKSQHIEFLGTTSEEGRMIVADLRVDGLSRDYWHVWPRAKGGLVGLCPLPHSDLFQLMMQINPSDEAADLTEKDLQHRWLAATGLKDIRLHSPAWVSIFRPNVRLVDRYRVGRAFLAGDAAHVHTPAGAQGLNTGIQDGYNLGWKLALVIKGAPDSLLDTYQEERMPVAANVLEISSKLFEGVHRKKLPKVTRGDRERQLLVNYRGCSLATETGAVIEGRLRAGDRAPDAPCSNQALAPCRLFDTFRGPHFTLLAFGHKAIAESRKITARPADLLRVVAVVPRLENIGGDLVIDGQGSIGRAYGIDGGDNAVVLVRPDGYVGHIAKSEWAKAIEGYLTAMIGPAARQVPAEEERRVSA
jgi:2-polyprenyl-6-methoxyphenol hydroxylase-like FAD-dependent oxidoreductase